MANVDKDLKLLAKQIASIEIAPWPFDQLERAERVNFANELLHKAYKLYGRRAGKDKERIIWEHAASVFHKACTEAYPPQFFEAMQELKLGNDKGLETAVQFLEDDPWFFGSGYIKADLLKYICRMNVSPDFAMRLQNVVINAIELRDRREFRHYCRLARTIETIAFKDQVDTLCTAANESVRRRARWVQKYIFLNKAKSK